MCQRLPQSPTVHRKTQADQHDRADEDNQIKDEEDLPNRIEPWEAVGCRSEQEADAASRQWEGELSPGEVPESNTKRSSFR